MKERILTGWTFARVIYLLIGILVIIQSIIDRNWILIAPGVYFAVMGLLAMGCAGGNCFGNSCTYQQDLKKSKK